MSAIERHSFPDTTVPKAYGAYSHAVTSMRRMSVGLEHADDLIADLDGAAG